MQKLSLICVIVSSLFIVPGEQAWMAAPSRKAPPPKAHARLVERASKGWVRVLVRVDADLAQTAPARVERARKLNAVASDYAQRSSQSYDAIPYLVMTINAADLAQMQNDPRVAGIYEDNQNEATLRDTTPLIGATQSWAAGYTGAGQAVAILDTGFDTSHPMLQGKTVAEACFSSTVPAANSVSLCPNGMEQQYGAGAAINCNPNGGGSMSSSCRHGTHVAGIAIGSSDVLSGVAPGANLIGLQVFSKITKDCPGGSPCLTAWDSDILRGLDQVYSWRNQFVIAAVNMSMGGGAYTIQSVCDANGQPYRDIFALLNQAGIPVVIAAGNGAYTNAITMPACITGAISAGATTKADTVASYSNSADFLSLLAPGNSVYSAIPGSYGTMSGTSMAAPHIAGAMAVLKSKMPNASVRQLYQALEQTGKPVIDSRAGANNRVKKRISLMDALNALDAISGVETFEPDDTPAQARPIALNSPQRHQFDVPNDHDWVTVQVQANHEYRFETLNLSPETDTVLELYSSDIGAGPLAYSDDVEQGIDRRSLITYTATQNGTLYLLVYDWNPGAFLNTQFDIQASEIALVTPTVGSTRTPDPSKTATPSPEPEVTATPQPHLTIKLHFPIMYSN